MNPLVHIDAGRLEEAIQGAGLSYREAARRMSTNGSRVWPQTFAHLLKGRQLRCRRKMLDGLAELTGKSVAWLQGKERRLLDRWLEGGDAALSREELAQLHVDNPSVPFRLVYDLAERAKMRIAWHEAARV